MVGEKKEWREKRDATATEKKKRERRQADMKIPNHGLKRHI